MQLGVIGLGAGIIAILGASLVAQSTREVELRAPTTQPAKKIDPAMLAAVEKLAVDLKSEAFSDREQTQKKLEAMGIGAIDAIRATLEKTGNEEAQARLRSAIVTINDREALDPSPISLDLREADINQIADALSDALGTPVTGLEFAAAEHVPRVTMDIKKEGLWRALAAINLKIPLDIGWNDSGGDLQLTGSDRRIFSQAHIAGPFLFYPVDIELNQKIEFGIKDGATSSFNLYMRMLTDPRVKVLMRSNFDITECVDDAGNDLIIPAKSQSALLYLNDMLLSGTIKLKYPAKPGKKIARVKGQVRIVVMLASRELQIPDLSKQVGKTITLEGFSFTLKSMAVEETKYNFNFESKVPKNCVIMDEGKATKVGGTVEVKDSQDRDAGPLCLDGSKSGLESYGKVTQPLRAKLIVPVRFKVVTVPFEFKNLPMP